MGFSRQEYWTGLPCPSPGNLRNPGIEPRSPALQEDSLLSEPPGKPKDTEMGSLSLLQGTFQTQESNPGLLHCRWFLYQLSYQGSPPYLVFMTQFKQCPFLEPSHLFPQPKGSLPLCSPGTLIGGNFVFAFGCIMQHIESYFPDHGIEPEPALEEQSLNCRTPREVP